MQVSGILSFLPHSLLLFSSFHFSHFSFHVKPSVSLLTTCFTPPTSRAREQGRTAYPSPARYLSGHTRFSSIYQSIFFPPLRPKLFIQPRNDKGVCCVYILKRVGLEQRRRAPTPTMACRRQACASPPAPSFLHHPLFPSPCDPSFIPPNPTLPPSSIHLNFRGSLLLWRLGS